MKKLVFMGMLLILVFGFTFSASATVNASTAQTYTVLVGAESVSRGAGVMSYFPGTLRIHVGDTVMWKVQTHEIHTVTFLSGQAMPALIIPAPNNFPAGSLQINPLAGFLIAPTNGKYDGSTYANSGILSTDPGQQRTFSLTFTKEGSFPYVCLVHGMMMSGTINVVAASVSVPSPAQVSIRAAVESTTALAHAIGLFGVAMDQVPAPIHNSDGSTTHYVLLGYSKGVYMQMNFFPKKLVVHPGDTVKFMLSKTDDAPHTVTFLNGGADIPLIVVTPNPPSPQPVLLFNPEVLMPIHPGQPLTRTGVFSSGLLSPGGPGPTSFSLKIGNISGMVTYQCLLHDTSGMIAQLIVIPK